MNKENSPPISLSLKPILVALALFLALNLCTFVSSHVYVILSPKSSVEFSTDNHLLLQVSQAKKLTHEAVKIPTSFDLLNSILLSFFRDTLVVSEKHNTRISELYYANIFPFIEDIKTLNAPKTFDLSEEKAEMLSFKLGVVPDKQASFYVVYNVLRGANLRTLPSAARSEILKGLAALFQGTSFQKLSVNEKILFTSTALAAVLSQITNGELVLCEQQKTARELVSYLGKEYFSHRQTKGVRDPLKDFFSDTNFDQIINYHHKTCK